jgi:hypothetical protein
MLNTAVSFPLCFHQNKNERNHIGQKNDKQNTPLPEVPKSKSKIDISNTQAHEISLS